MTTHSVSATLQDRAVHRARSIALSREIPAALRFVVDPIGRRVSRNSLFGLLQQTERSGARQLRHGRQVCRSFGKCRTIARRFSSTLE
jgi:hypothetical protein